MKFGKYILSVSTEWTTYYMNYKALKKIIKGEDDEKKSEVESISTDPLSAATIENRKTKFFFRLERELEKVNSFYIQKENELKIRLNALCKKTVISAALKEALIQFQMDLEKLQKFVQINNTGFRKILKKWDKRSKASTKEIYLSRQVEVQPVFNTEILTNLQDRAATFLQELEMKLKSADGENNVEMYLECPPQVIGFLENNLHDLLKSWVEKHDVPLSRLFLDYCTETSIECLSILLETGRVDCNFTDDINDHTCLHILAIDGNLDALKLCLQYQAKISLDYYGRSPLHYAALRGHADTCLFLLSLEDHQVLLNQPDQDGNTPLINSITAGHLKVLEAFISSGASIEPPNITTPNVNPSKVPLIVACQSGHLDIVKYLLSLTKNITTIPPTTDGLTTLHLSCRQGQTEITKCLIDHMRSSDIPAHVIQEEIDRRDAFTGWTPLFCAASEGHIGCVRILLEAGCRVDLKDDGDWSARTYCLYRGHMDAAALLLEYEERRAIADLEKGDPPQSSVGFGVFEKNREERMSGGTLDETDGKSGSGIANTMGELDLDDIPSLSLPPPIIPLRIYGHHYLDKKFLVQIQLGTHSASTGQLMHPVSLSGSRQLYSLKLKITANSDRDHAFFANLPLKEDLTTYSYTTSTLNHSSMEFDLYPVFGTVAIGRGCLPSSQFHALVEQSLDGVVMPECTIALFDTHLRVLGHVSFRLNLVRPFIHPSLSIGNGQIETYWKSTTVVSNPPSTTPTNPGNGQDGNDQPVHSLVTASSLVEEYIELVVQSTKDYHIVVYPKSTIPVQIGRVHVIEIPLSSLTLDEARAAFEAQSTNTPVDSTRNFAHASSAVIANHVYSSFMTLEEALKNLPNSVGFSIIVQYLKESPSRICMNAFIDKVLKLCYDFSNRRSLIFSSFNEMVCTILNWKQPNYGVFFRTFCGFLTLESRELQKNSLSIKESIKFAKNCSLLGIVCESKALVEMPALVQTIKESGLMLATFGEENRLPNNISVQEKAGADATIKDYVWKNNNQV